MTLLRLLALVPLGLLTASPVLPHHSVSNFQADSEVTVSGEVTYVSFSNPHSYIDLQTTGANKRAWKVFATSRVVLQRYGWSQDSVKPGDTITVTGRPDKTKPREMYLTRIIFADGTEWLRSSIDN